MTSPDTTTYTSENVGHWLRVRSTGVTRALIVPRRPIRPAPSTAVFSEFQAGEIRARALLARIDGKEG